MVYSSASCGSIILLRRPRVETCSPTTGYYTCYIFYICCCCHCCHCCHAALLGVFVLQQGVSRTLEEENARLSKRAAELEELSNSAATVRATGAASSEQEEAAGENGEDGWEVVGEGDREKARLEEVRA